MDTRPGRNAKEWRDRAEEYRRFAEEATDDAVRESYFAVADSCDEMAERMEWKREGSRPAANAPEWLGRS